MMMRRRADSVRRRLRVASVTVQPDQVRRLDELVAVQRRTRSFVLRDVIDTGLGAMRGPAAAR
jgi:predicted DNA-binding protein